MPERPPTEVSLTWEGGLRFRGDAGGRSLSLDADGAAAVSPVEALAFALAGCMGADLVHILKKQRVELNGLQIAFAGRRAEMEPRRFLAIELRFRIEAAVEADRVERALALSRERYCSVWHSLAPDITFTTRFEIVSA